MIIKKGCVLVFIFIISLICCSKEINENTKKYTIKDGNLWVYVEIDENKRLNAVTINDTFGRSIDVNFSDLGIKHYQLNDETGYRMETVFSEEYSLYGQLVMPGPDGIRPITPDMKIAENAFFRYENKGQAEFRYIVDYLTPPYFFIYGPKSQLIQNEIQE
jgi:hypothetical protein